MALTPYSWHAEAAEQLSHLREKLPNAVLIHGARGSGVFELGRAFAQSLLCDSPAEDGTPCGRCRSCVLFKAGSHPDIRIVVSEWVAQRFELPYVPADSDRGGPRKPSREVRIHQVRALDDFIGLTSNRGGRRVILLYPADMVRDEAASAILKSMEEPPEGLVFVLCAEDIDGVLPTIRSRSRLLRVPLPGRDEAIEFLKKKRVKNPEEALAAAGGAPLAVLDADAEPHLAGAAAKTVRGLLERGPEITLDEIIRACPKEYAVPGLALALARWIHDLIRVKSGLAPRYAPGDAETLSQLAARADEAALWDFLAVAGGIRRAAEHPLSARQVWEAAFVRYMRIWGR